MQFAKFRKELWTALRQPVWEGPLFTKRRCRLALVISGCALLMLGGLVLLFLPREDSLKPACERVQKGMTPAEVEQVFGRPPDHTHLDDDEFWRAVREVDPDRRDVRSWKGEGGCSAGVVFRRDRVSGVYWHPAPANTLNELRRWFPFLNFK